MRIYHKYYRSKNPSGKKMSAEKTDLKLIISKSLNSSIGIKKRNPATRKASGEIVDVFNLLGQINSYIDEGHSELIPLRDVVSARIEGYLNQDALDYSLTEAIRGLSKAQINVVKGMIDKAGGEVTPEQRKAINKLSRHHPSVLAARNRLEKAEDSDEAFRAAIRQGKLTTQQYTIGPSRLSAMKEQDAAAKEEAGTDKYKPADKKLWSRVGSDLEKIYPNHFIPAKLASKKKEEAQLLSMISDDSINEDDKNRIRKRLKTAISNRWQTEHIKEYEKRGGEELSQSEYKRREDQRIKGVGVAVELGHGFFGAIKGPENSGYSWYLFDKNREVYMSGHSPSKISASKNIGISFRILMNLLKLGDNAGWDNLPSTDIRWLESNKPKLSKTMARIFRAEMGEHRHVSRETAEWVMGAAAMPTFTEVDEGEDMAKVSKKMTLGEEIVIPAANKKYDIHVKKSAGNKFTFFVAMNDGRRSAIVRTTDFDDIVRKAGVIAGMMNGAIEASKAISNPSKAKRIHGQASKFFRKINPSPKLERSAAESGDIREMSGMVGVPNDPDEAYRYGFYAGIIRGIDTCGVQNYFKRKKIRNEFQQRLLSAAMEETSRVTGTGRSQGSSGRRKHRRSKGDVSATDVEDEVDAPPAPKPAPTAKRDFQSFLDDLLKG